MADIKIFTLRDIDYQLYPTIQNLCNGEHLGKILAEKCLGKTYDNAHNYSFAFFEYNSDDIINIIDKDNISDLFFFVDFKINFQLPSVVMKVINRKLNHNVNVFFCCHFEPFSKEALQYLSSCLDLSNRSKSTVWFINANADIFNHPIRPSSLNVAYFDFFSGFYIFGLEEYTKQYTKPILPNADNIEQKDFLCLNFKPRKTRRFFIDLLQEKNLYNNGYVSHNGKTLEGITDTPGYTFGYSGVLIPTFLDISPWTNKVYYEIVMEDVHGTMPGDEKYIFFSEKFYRAIHNKNPFLIFGKPKLLKFIKASGFKTYDGLFDEHYDNIINWQRRARAIVHEVKKFSKKSIQEKIEWQKTANEIAEYNYQHLTNMSNISKLYLEPMYNED